MIRVSRGDALVHVLGDDLYCDETRVIAVIAWMDYQHPRGGGRHLVVARAGGGRLRLAPCFAEEGGAGPNGQCERNRKYKCSNHVMLGFVRQQEGRQ